MGSQAGHDHRSAVAIISRIVDVLHAGSKIDSAPGVDGVIRFHDILAAVIEAAIAQQKTFAAIREIHLMIFFDAIRYESKSSAVLFAMP